MNEHQQHNGGLRPVPDPTILTTATIEREVKALRELLEVRIFGLDDKVDARFDGMDKAISLIQTAADKMPNEVDLKAGNLQSLMLEKFSGIQTQFQERDTRIEETANLNKLAIDAALQAAKEAVGKTETAFTKQIDQLTELIKLNTAALDSKIISMFTALDSKIFANMTALDGKIGANKERLDRIEGQSSGYSGSWAVLMGIAGLAVGVIIIAIRLLGGE